MRKIVVTIMSALLIGSASLCAQESVNLVKNSSFEDFTDYNNAMFGAYTEFNQWNRQGFSTLSEKTDVYDGAVAMRLGAATAAATYQEITGLNDANYDTDARFRLTFHYKAVSLASSGSVSIDSYWVHTTTADALKTHDAGMLQRTLSDTVQSEWQTVVIETTRPAGAKSFMLQFRTTAKTYMLLDSISFEQLPSAATDEPFITVTPKSVQSVTCEIGNTVDFQTIHIEHGNVATPTTFYIGGNDRNHFRLSATELATDKQSIDLIVTYAPQSAGTHTASLVFDNTNHTTILPDMILLQASCTDPTAVPTIIVTPSIVPAFEAIAGRQVTQEITVKSENCTDLVYLNVTHVEGEAFIVGSSVLPKNYETKVTITFYPREEGTYQSLLTLRTEGGQSVVLTLNGTATAATPETVDWATDFVWNDTQPLTLLDETFDNISHNATLVLDGWQNVAAAQQRPWWGFDETLTSPVRGTNRYAKATAYQSQTASTGTWETWLVTPALDYTNAEGKVFAFSVMGEYMPEEENPATLELFYIDATDPTQVFFQVFDGLSIPKTEDENNVWVPFRIHLEDQPNISIFHMAFRFTSPSGVDGGVTYYIDNVSWGRTDLTGIDDVQSENTLNGRWTKTLRNGTLLIERNGVKYNVLGVRIK